MISVEKGCGMSMDVPGYPGHAESDFAGTTAKAAPFGYVKCSHGGCQYLGMDSY